MQTQQSKTNSQNDRKAISPKSRGVTRLQTSLKEQQREEALKRMEEKKAAKAKKNSQFEDTACAFERGMVNMLIVQFSYAGGRYYILHIMK